MQTAAGKSIQNGIAIGRIKVYRAPKAEISAELIIDTEAELGRFDAAVEKAADQQNALYAQAMETAGEQTAAIFSVHAMMLKDQSLSDAVHEIIACGKHTAEYAVKQAFDQQARVFADMDDPYMKERSADIYEIEDAVLQVLMGIKPDRSDWTEPVILAAEDLSPSELAGFDRSLLLGIITRAGSFNSHTAILARSMNLPALINCRDVSDDWDGHMAVLDGGHSCVYIDPAQELLEEMTEKQKEEERERVRLKELKGQKSMTADGTLVRVCANIGSLSDLNDALENDAEGIGLFRSEFLYLNRKDYPSEDEQFEVYRRAVRAFAPKQVIIRTCDLGADKKADYMELPREENPALGLRGVRFSLLRKDLFKTQLRALLRASAYGDLGIMFPMIVSTEELHACRLLLKECKSELEEERVKTGEPSVGIMIETPAAVLCADELAEECGFFSIGTNDLTQYICASDRQNAALDPFSDPHHPAVLRAVRMTAEAAHRHNIRVGICGELGSDLSLTETFLQMGIDELSVSPQNVLPLRKQIRSLDLG